MRKRDKQRGRNFVKKRWISRSLLPFDARQRLGHTSLERSETKHNHGKDQRPGPGTTPVRAVSARRVTHPLSTPTLPLRYAETHNAPYWRGIAGAAGRGAIPVVGEPPARSEVRAGAR